MFDSPGKLLLGLVTGVIFGVLLQKGRAAKHSVIVGQLLLRDWTVVKIMATAIAVGGVGVYAFAGLGWTELDIKPFDIAGIAIGAVLFGSGLAVLGYCPGTTVAAVGEGRRDAIAGLAGMFAGAGAFVVGYALFQRIQKASGGWGEVTLPGLTSTPAWPWLVAAAAAVIAAYVAERVRRRRGRLDRRDAAAPA
jgi:hypothetical protein